MSKAKALFQKNPVIEMIAQMSVGKRIALGVVSAFAGTGLMAFTNILHGTASMVLMLPFLLFGIILWYTLIASFIKTPETRIRVANIAAVFYVFLIVVVLIQNAFGLGLRSNRELVASALSPDGTKLVEGYVYDPQKDDSFYGEVYVRVLDGQRRQYTRVFHEKSLTRLEVHWVDDDTIAVNGKKMNI